MDEPHTVQKDHVFISCPFDSEFRPLLRSILFVVVYLGFKPRLASERSDSAEVRLRKIVGLIARSRLSIHDLSLLKPNPDEYARMNMPFELGVDFGARMYGNEALRSKQFLILGSRPHDFKIALSDLSGVDIKAHADDTLGVVKALRNWFYDTVGITSAQPPSSIWYAMEDFQRYLQNTRVDALLEKRPDLSQEQAKKDIRGDIVSMPIAEYIDSATDWVAGDLGSQ